MTWAASRATRGISWIALAPVPITPMRLPAAFSRGHGTTTHRRLAPEVRREQLLDAALDVVVDSGVDAVTVEAVAQRAGVTRPVVYDMFGDLEGSMLALIDREEATAMAPLLAIAGPDPGDDVDPEAFLFEAILAFLRAVRSNPRTWRLVLMPPRGSSSELREARGSSSELRERIRRSRRLLAERITRLLDWGIARRGGPQGLDHDLLSRMIVAAGGDAARLMLAHPSLLARAPGRPDRVPARAGATGSAAARHAGAPRVTAARALGRGALSPGAGQRSRAPSAASSCSTCPWRCSPTRASTR
jgi:AcrR family transcriptional regulator